MSQRLKRLFLFLFLQINLPKLKDNLLTKVEGGLFQKTHPFLISANQSALVEGQFINEGGRWLISDLLEISNTLKLGSLLATIDIQKAFESVEHSFLISKVEKYWFGNQFVKWVKMLLETS